MLSETALKVLREYWEEYRPQKWLFEGAKEGRYLSTRTVQAIFEQAKEKAGIKKDVSVHSLRHSFARVCDKNMGRFDNSFYLAYNLNAC